MKQNLEPAFDSIEGGHDRTASTMFTCHSRPASPKLPAYR
jgi:hypothetical protein